MTRKICILDDDPVTLTLAAGVLQRDFDSVSTFSNVAEARQHLQEHRPDILVLDLQLPGFSGVTVLEWAREINPFVRVVVITGEAPVTRLLDCWRLGADCCVLKGEGFAPLLSAAVHQADEALALWESSIAAMRQHHRRVATSAAARGNS